MVERLHEGKVKKKEQSATYNREVQCVCCVLCII